MTTALKHISQVELRVAEHVTQKLIMDGHKLPWHIDRVRAWERGERIAPVLIDMALTRQCQMSCSFCYAMLQENARSEITVEVMDGFLQDCAEMGVKAISLLSDGESTISPAFDFTVRRGKERGLYMALGSNCLALTRQRIPRVLPYLSYIRMNVPAGEQNRYCEIMGVKPRVFDIVCQNIREMVALKKEWGLEVTLGMQMVLMPQDADQVIPFAKLGRELGVDYAVVKHCADDEYGSLGVEYDKYKEIFPILEEAESYSTDTYKVTAQWSKIETGGKRSYQRCYGPPFILQISGSGLVAPCGDKFNDRYAKFHIGNICEQRFKDIWQSERYWEVMDYLASEDFDAQRMCGPLCRQHKINEALDAHKRGIRMLEEAKGSEPLHRDFL